MTEKSKNGSGERFEVAVIGGEQAGLAIGYFLAKGAKRLHPGVDAEVAATPRSVTS